MRITLILFFVVLASSAAAKTKHNHKAHDHGHAKLDIAVDGKTISIELEAPGDVVFGFEHRPKSEKDKATVKNEMTRLNDKVLELFIPPGDAGCTLTEKDVESSQAEAHNEKDKGHGEHADVLASYTINCASDLKGKTMSLGMFKAWPRLKSLKLQVLSGTGQKGRTLKNDVTDISL